MTDQANRPNRKILEGKVISDKMDKTCVVAVGHTKRDSKYRKILHLTTKIHAHDEKNEAKTGDRVRVMSTRPLSKLKRWRIDKILEKRVEA